MAIGQNPLLPYRIANQQTLQSNFSTIPTNIQNQDNIAIQLGWTGNGTGTFTIEGSVNYKAAAYSNTVLWEPLSLGSTITASGVAGHTLVNLAALGFPYIRVSYASTFLSASITTVADTAGSLAGTYVQINAVTSKYALWFKVSGSGSAPSIPGYTNVEVDISTGDTNTAVATALGTAIAALSGLEREALSGHTVNFNIIATGGAVTAGTSGFTVSNTDTTGVVDGFITGKAV